MLDIIAEDGNEHDMYADEGWLRCRVHSPIFSRLDGFKLKVSGRSSMFGSTASVTSKFRKQLFVSGQIMPDRQTDNSKISIQGRSNMVFKYLVGGVLGVVSLLPIIILILITVVHLSVHSSRKYHRKQFDPC